MIVLGVSILQPKSGQDKMVEDLLTMKVPSKCADDILIFFFYFSENICIRLYISCESSAWQTIHMKCQVLFYSEKYEKKKPNQNVSASDVIGDLRAKKGY